MEINNHKELEKIFHEKYDEWCLVSFMYLKCKSEAEDTVQDVCAKILSKRPSTKILDLNAYIKTAVKNRSLKKLKHAKKFDTLNETQSLAYPSPENPTQSYSPKDTGIMWKAITTLPEPRKVVFERCVIEGKKYQETADELGISVNTVKYHIKQAYKSLRLQMKDAYLLVLYLALFPLF